MPAAASTAEVYELLRQSGIHSPARLAALIPDPSALPSDPQKALGHLVSRRVLTRFQAEQLMQGRHRGFRLGSYVIQSQLGRGGMGAVYLAEHQELRRKVAVKVLMAAKDADHNLAMERFVREARAAAALDHPNIVRIHDVSRSGGAPFLVMEYVDGQTLQQILDRDGYVPYTSAADYISQAAAGLQHAYEKGFVHRDIKPANLMLGKDGTVKLLDMGLARSNIDPGDKLTERLDNGAVVGTADYIAPEQALNSPGIDIRADIYSLGATFFALITGKPPFDGNTAQKLIQHQIADVPDMSAFDESLPDELIEIATTMLAKRPEDRYQTPGEVIAALAPWVANNSHVMAGLSRTNIGASGDLQDTIDRISEVSSTRINRGSDSGVNPSRAARETGSFAAPATTRNSTGRLNTKKQKKAPGVSKAAIIATVAAGVLAVGAIVWAASSRSDDTPAQRIPPRAPEKGDEPPVFARGPIENAKPPVQANNPPPQKQTKANVFKLDLASVAPFRTQKEWTKHLGGDTEQLPPGVTCGCWNRDATGEFRCEEVNGARALGITNLSDAKSGQFGFELEKGMGVALKPNTAYQVKLEYLTRNESAGWVSVQTADTKPLASQPLRGSGGGWKTETVTFTRKDQPIRLTVENTTVGEGNTLLFRGLEVNEVDTAGTGALYSLTFDGVPVFLKQVAQGRNGIGGEERMPPHVLGLCWAQGASGEFRCEVYDGAKAIGFANFTDKQSAQLLIQFENAPGGELAAGKSYVMRVVYRTTNAGTGRFAIQGGGPGYTKYANANVAGSNEWKTVEVPFVRPAERVSAALDCTAVGEGNRVYVRSVEIVEAGEGAK